MKDKILYPKAFKFAVKVVNVYKRHIAQFKEYDLSRQFLRSGTSIGANLAEANGAISKADFSAKVSIAYKESLETKFWLDLFHETDYMSSVEHKDLYNDADELSRIMFSILKTTRIDN